MWRLREKQNCTDSRSILPRWYLFISTGKKKVTWQKPGWHPLNQVVTVTITISGAHQHRVPPDRLFWDGHDTPAEAHLPKCVPCIYSRRHRQTPSWEEGPCSFLKSPRRDPDWGTVRVTGDSTCQQRGSLGLENTFPIPVETTTGTTGGSPQGPWTGQ